MGPKPELRVVLLGGFEVRVADRAVEPSAWRLSKAKDMIKLLALSSGRRLQRDQVLESLWPGRDPSSAVNNLHQVLHVARRAIDSVRGDGHDCLRLETETLVLCPGGNLVVDADEYEAEARKALVSHDKDDYVRAIRLYTGELLPEDRYADWATGRREILHRLKLDLLAGLAHLLEKGGDLTGSADTLRQLLLEDPAHEPAHRDLMRVYALAGDRSAAARQFETLERTLHRELGVLPEQATRFLHDEIEKGNVAPLQHSASERSSLPATNLGNQRSSFVGRAKELADVRRLMAESRMVTLVGAGGCGKTRLAVEVGRRSFDNYEGVFVVELGPVTNQADVALELMRTLDARRGPDESPAQAISNRIATRKVLLIVDNCEHLAAEVARLADELLSACPRLEILATSREPIRISGEVVRRVSSLQVPDPEAALSIDELAEYEAIQLFAERTRAVQSDFEIDEGNAADVASVCFRLDGMPLALELAAARVPALSVSGVAENLDDRFRLLTDGPRTALSRQRTLKATVDWSFDLLTPEERDLFLRLSVFNGAFDLGATRALASESSESRVAAVLSRLVERSMVVVDDVGTMPRYRLLETVRAYGLDRLRSEGKLADLQDDHARWLLALVEGSGGHGLAAERHLLVSTLSMVHDELRPAIDHLVATRPKDAVQLISLLWPYWLWHSHLGEGLTLIELVLEHVVGPSLETADLLIGASALAFRWKGFEEMERYASMSLDEFEALEDRAGICRALLFSAIGPFDRDEFNTARARFDRALELARREQNTALEISANLCLAMLAASRLRFTEAGDILEGAQTLASDLEEGEGVLDIYTLGAWTPTRRRGERLHMWCETFVSFEDGIGRLGPAAILSARGNLERLAGRPDRAESLLEEALLVYEKAGDQAGQAGALCWMGQLAFDLGEFDSAEHYLRKSLEIRRRILHLRGVVACLINLVRLATELGEIDKARRYLLEAEDLCRNRADRIGTALVRVERAQVGIADDDAFYAVSELSGALPLVRAFGGYGLNIACIMRDLGEAQSRAGLETDASNSLVEASHIFRKNGYVEEADRCEKMMAP